MSASLINDVGSIIVIGDEPGRMLPSAAGIVTQSNSDRQREIYPRSSATKRHKRHKNGSRTLRASNSLLCFLCLFVAKILQTVSKL